MSLKRIFVLIEKIMGKKDKYKYKKEFCEKNDIDYKTFMTTYARVVDNGKDVQYGTVVKYLKAVGYKLVAVKEKE